MAVLDTAISSGVLEEITGSGPVMTRYKPVMAVLDTAILERVGGDHRVKPANDVLQTVT